MTIKAIKEKYKDYKLQSNEKNMFTVYDYNDGNGKVVIVVNNCKGYGKRIRDHTEKDSFDTGYIFMCFSGDHSLWSTDAGCDICGE